MYIVDLWFQIGMKFIDYAQVVGKTVGRFLTADPTKWLGIVNEIIGAVSDLLEFVQDLMTLIMDKWSATITSMFDLERAFADVSGSVGGAWPTVANLS